MPPAKKFNGLIVNSENKIRLQAFFKKRSKFLLRCMAIRFIVLTRKNALFVFLFQPNKYFIVTKKKQTRIFYHAKLIDQRADVDSIIIDAERCRCGGDFCFCFKCSAQKIDWRKQKQKYSCIDFCSNDVKDVLIGFHALTGADAVSGFYRQSKKGVFKKLCRYSESRSLIRNIGKKVHLDEEDIKNDDVEKFG